MPLVDQFYKSKNKKINYYVHSHEQNWDMLQLVMLKISTNGISIVTNGPGLTNMIIQC